MSEEPQHTLHHGYTISKKTISNPENRTMALRGLVAFRTGLVQETHGAYQTLHHDPWTPNAEPSTLNLHPKPET